MDSQTVTLISSAIAVLGTIVAGWFGYRAKQAETRIVAQNKTNELAGGITLNERQEAAAIRQAQVLEIREQREIIARKDEQIDKLQDLVRDLKSTVDHRDIQLERQQEQIETLKGQVSTLLRELGRPTP